MSLISNIKALCAKNKISVSKMERDVGLSPRYIYKWANSVPTVDKVKSIADYFGVTIDYLLKPDFLDKLAKLLDINQMSPSKLADLAGILPSRLDQILDGANPDLYEIKNISDVLGVDPTYFSEIELNEDRAAMRSAEIEICEIIKELSDEKLHTVLTVVRALAAE